MCLTSPIHINISKFESSWMAGEASSQHLRKATAEADDESGSDIPTARNKLKSE